MRITNILVIVLTSMTLFISCGRQNRKNTTEVDDKSEVANQNNDSIELTNLTRQVYEWHMTQRLEDFPYKFDKQQDSIFIGLDWEKYQSNLDLFKQTNFFTSDFLLKHKNIALTLDSSIKKTDIVWRNINDGISIWDTDADVWCECQDHPDNYWTFLSIDILTIKDGYAEFNWTWDKEISSYPYEYKVTAKKEKGKWKINSLDGFKNYFSVEHYDKIINN